MRILTSLVVVAALSGCAYQSGYIDPQGVWIAKGEPYARGTCRSTAPYAIGPQGPVGLRCGSTVTNKTCTWLDFSPSNFMAFFKSNKVVGHTSGQCV